MGLITLAEAQQWVVDQTPVLTAGPVKLRDALGCVLSERLVSGEAVPPFANTAMDGYAVRAGDTATASPTKPVRLPVVATLAAGASPDGLVVRAGEAIRIMTGAAMPAGADAVVPVENTKRSSSDAAFVDIVEAARFGDAVRPSGEDIQVGQVVFEAGTELGPGHLGVLSSIGLAVAPCYRRPRVGVLSTGDELVEAPTPLRDGQIRDSNRLTLLGLLARANCEPVDLGVAADDEKLIESAIRRGLAECDALVTSGGVSMGDFDWVKVVLDRLGADSGGAMRWMQIDIRPAKPLAFGVVGARPVFGLPGNPVSAMVSFELFARPALRKMMGHPSSCRFRTPVVGLAGEDLRRRPDGKTHFVRVSADFDDSGRLVVRSSGGQGSNLLRAMALANALAVLPDGPGVGAGDPVDVLLLS